MLFSRLPLPLKKIDEMKKFLLLAFTPFLFTGATAQCPTNLFFSEYIEGGSFNKALEIYNPLPTTVNLGDYVVELYTNGSPTASIQFFLAGSLAPGQTYVICHSSANATIQGIKDTVSGVTNFNGNDAVLLKHEFTFDTLDIIGVVGVDPGVSWIVGTGSTLNKTLVRNSNVGIGTTNWALSATQWSVFAQDYTDSLGTHYCNAPQDKYTFENFTICDNQSILIQGTHTETTAGIYYDTLTAFSGCDSIIVTELFVNPTFYALKDTSTCPGGSLFLAGANQTVAGVYTENYLTSLGCDSIIDYNFTFYTEPFVQVNQSICQGDSAFLEGGWQLLGGVYNDTYTSVITGCDSLVETTLSITNVNVSVTQSGFDLTAAATGVTYQWLDCNNSFTQVPGATNQAYTGTYNSDFAVKITNMGCVDTSTCFTISGIGFDELAMSTNILLYPNPASNLLNIFAPDFTNGTLEIFSIDGQLVYSEPTSSEQLFIIDLSKFENGIYTVRLFGNDKIESLRFIKN